MADAGAVCMHLRVCVSGASGAGKSSLITRIISGVCPATALATIGVDYQSKAVATSHGLAASIHFRDLAGQERFRSVCSSSYRGADAVLVVFDLPGGCVGGDDAPYWIDQASQFAGADVPVLLVANKTDVEAPHADRARALEMHGITETVEALAYSGSIYFVSAKTGAGVADVVAALCHILESTERYLDIASAVAVEDVEARKHHARGAISGSAYADADIAAPSADGALLNVVCGAGGTPRIVKAPQFVKLVGGDPAKEPGSSQFQGSSASRAQSAESRRASDFGGCAC